MTRTDKREKIDEQLKKTEAFFNYELEGRDLDKSQLTSEKYDGSRLRNQSSKFERRGTLSKGEKSSIFGDQTINEIQQLPGYHNLENNQHAYHQRIRTQLNSRSITGILDNSYSKS